jgi:hypothetical protein
VPASRSKTCFDECSPVLRSFSGSAANAASSGVERHSHEGTVSSSTFFSRAGTPALRKYFWASTSAATCDQKLGTSTSAAWNTTEPSGLRISLSVNRNAMSA